MRRNSVGWNDASADHINRKHEKMIMKGRSQGKTTANLDELEHGNDVTHMLGNLALETAANGESAAAEWVLNAKRSTFFLQLEQHAQQWATADIYMPALLRSGLFRTVSDRAMLCAWGWQLEATNSAQ